MSDTQILPPEEVAAIAARFGFEPDDPEVVEEAEAARKAHGQVSEGYNGDARVYWHVDPRTRRIDAAQLLAGHLKEQAGCKAPTAARSDPSTTQPTAATELPMGLGTA